MSPAGHARRVHRPPQLRPAAYRPGQAAPPTLPTIGPHTTHHSAVTTRDRRPIMASARYRPMRRDDVCLTNSMSCAMRRLCARAKISVDHAVWRPFAKSADPSRV
jgi:hypothetical protein